ncbi:histidine N-acetyltransferase [Exaiptasia diaphana]|uniref:N-acetyltransferase domain-containing protein n=1 Tax=Exaiptasia diaphana TaxID=2652724 RepID=A0A913YEZ5_EXADI|nr:histidine N-acetyltransferase [Exaiptasia diaphana]KXJ16956.1 putative N-acetyltransferase 16 [Exaiptasia diaphana]
MDEKSQKVGSQNKAATRLSGKHKIRVRLAREEDYKDLLRISEGIYGGLDSLPLRFHDWLKIPNKLVYLAELEGKVVGVSVASIVSSGKTCMSSTFRIHNDYRGQGLSSSIEAEIAIDLRRI